MKKKYICSLAIVIFIGCNAEKPRILESPKEQDPSPLEKIIEKTTQNKKEEYTPENLKHIEETIQELFDKKEIFPSTYSYEEKIKALTLLYDLTKQNLLVDFGIQMAAKLISASEPTFATYGFILLEELLTKEQGINKIIQNIEKNSVNQVLENIQLILETPETSRAKETAASILIEMVKKHEEEELNIAPPGNILKNIENKTRPLLSSITSESQLLKILEQNNFVCVFFSNDNCDSCDKSLPSLLLAALTKPKIAFVQTNTIEDDSLKFHLHVPEIPTTILFIDGKEISRMAGTPSYKKLETFMNQHIPKSQKISAENKPKNQNS